MPRYVRHSGSANVCPQGCSLNVCPHVCGLYSYRAAGRGVRQCQFRRFLDACNGSPMAGWPERCSRCLGVLLRSVLLILLLLLRLLLWRLTASSLDPRASSLDSIGTRRNSSVLFELADLRATGARRRSSYESFRAVRFSFERFRIVSTSFEGCRVFVASLFVCVAKSSEQFRIVPKGFS